MSQVGDLSQLLVLTVGSVLLARHRVMRWSAWCLQCAILVRCARFQLLALARLEWASSQEGGCWLSAPGLQCTSLDQGYPAPA
jgi:hypothetical protein